MAATLHLSAVAPPPSSSSSSLFATQPPRATRFLKKNSATPTRSPTGTTPLRVSVRVRAAKLPAGVEVPRAQPKLSEPFLGFTKTAEIWNSRACMMGLIGTFIVELILNKGVLEIIGFEVGKGLDIPL